MNEKPRAAVQSFASALPLAVLLTACFTHTVESAPIEIKPIHITMDINLRVQRELDEFFDFEEPAKPDTPTTTPPSEEQPKE
jgi:hypothetical protein